MSFQNSNGHLNQKELRSMQDTVEKLLKQNKKLQEENSKLRKDVEKLKSRLRPDNKSVRESSGMGRREFLKKTGLGIAGLAALGVSPASALNIKSDSLSFEDSTNEYLDITSGGPVNIQNADLDLNDNKIINFSTLSGLDVQPERNLELPNVSSDTDQSDNNIWVEDGDVKVQVQGVTKILASTTTTEVINDFESQDGQSPNSEWGSETNTRNDNTSTDGFNTSNPISGSASRQLAGDGGGTDYQYTRSSAITPEEISCKMRGLQRDGWDGDESRIRVWSDNTIVIGIQLEANGDIDVNQTDTGTSWNLDTNYQIRIFNIDWSAETFDWEVKDLDSDTVAANGADSFRNSVSSMNKVEYGMSNGGSGGTVETVYDDLKVVI